MSATDELKPPGQCKDTVRSVNKYLHTIAIFGIESREIDGRRRSFVCVNILKDEGFNVAFRRTDLSAYREPLIAWTEILIIEVLR